MERVEIEEMRYAINNSQQPAARPLKAGLAPAMVAPLASLSARFFRTRPADPSEERVRRYLETGATLPKI
ncbi:MAG: hypothetical protein ACRBK7_32190 [Acidimicrobiales bacterium]